MASAFALAMNRGKIIFNFVDLKNLRIFRRLFCAEVERNDWKWLRVRCAMNSGNVIFTRGGVTVRGICCDRLYGRRVTGQRNLYDKVLLQNTRDKIDKLHKAVLVWNVQNKNINP